MKRFMMLLSLVCLACFAFALHASSKNDKAVVVRLSNLKTKASFGAPTIKQVKLGYQVSILSRQSGWVLVQGLKDKRRGWLRSYQLRTNISPKRLQIAQKQSSGNGLAGLSRSASALLGSTKKPQQGGSVVATIGVRGLSEQELQQAKPNPAELKKMQSYVSNKTAAAQFARQGKLQVQK